jgi:hypothetical protein
MKHELRSAGRLAGALAMAALLSLPGAAVAQSLRTGAGVDGSYSTANMLRGIVQSSNRDLNYITVRDQATGQNVKIDVRKMDARQSVDVWRLRAGDRIVVNGGWENRDTFQASRVNFSSMQQSSAINPNGLTGVVQSSNRDLNYITVRDQATGRNVKIDVRKMDTRQSVDVWKLRNGDTIFVNGGWSNSDTFRANRVNFPTYQPMTSAAGSANLVTGTVDGVNRDLNYVTIRNDATGQMVKIDVRSLNTRQSVNVWQLRPGDRITVNGGWEKNDTFRASTVNF